MLRIASFLALAASSAFAQSVETCDWQAHPDAIVEPWSENTRVFADGAVRLALLDTIEPAASPYWLMVLSPPVDEMGSRICQVVGRGPGYGFSDMEFEALSADYDPQTGLGFAIPVGLYNPETSLTDPAMLRLHLDQRDGTLSATLE